ncbi:MAG: bacteriocin [Atopobiaceae bacterium]|nr:bacteriocin [Atopobiaceae bacterium]
MAEDKMNELTDEDLDQVSGGAEAAGGSTGSTVCKNCHSTNVEEVTGRHGTQSVSFFLCKNCGYNWVVFR